MNIMFWPVASAVVIFCLYHAHTVHFGCFSSKYYQQVIYTKPGARYYSLSEGWLVSGKEIIKMLSIVCCVLLAELD